MKNHKEEPAIKATSGIHALKSQITAMDAALRHLDSTVNGHIKTLNTLMNKGVNVKPARVATPHVAQGKSLLEQLATSSLRAFAGGGSRSVAGQMLGGGSDSGSGDYASNMSQGQMMGQLASEISRAMSRNL